MDLREKPDDMPAKEWFELQDRRWESEERRRKIRAMQERRFRAEAADAARRRAIPTEPLDSYDMVELSRPGLRREAFEAARERRASRRAPYNPTDSPPKRREEAWCQERYGKSCAELSNWRQRAVDSCKRRNLSRDCSDPAFIE